MSAFDQVAFNKKPKAFGPAKKFGKTKKFLAS
jgi:hypothetical protein